MLMTTPKKSLSLATLIAFAGAAPEKETVAGLWLGTSPAREGATGLDRLTLLEDDRGLLFGDWGGMIVTGRHLNSGKIELRGRTPQGSYHVSGCQGEDNTLILTYVLKDLAGSGGRHEGACILRRPLREARPDAPDKP